MIGSIDMVMKSDIMQICRFCLLMSFAIVVTSWCASSLLIEYAKEKSPQLEVGVVPRSKFI